MPRPAHYREYEDMPEVVPGVFVDPGEGVYLVDDEAEVVCWVNTEWEDPMAVTAMVNAVALATAKGTAAVRKSLKNKGMTLTALFEETAEKTI